MTFAHPGASHAHSLETLSLLYEYDDFMMSIQTLVDLGCGTGDDLIWWATATTRDDVPQPLNIACTGVDLIQEQPLLQKYPNVSYQATDFEGAIQRPSNGFDVLWCHDAFQFVRNPLGTLANWWHLASPGGMLCLTVPITQRIHHRQLAYELPAGQHFHYSMVSLIHMLAATGWDCGSGFFKQSPAEPWIQAIVYKSEHAPLPAQDSNWHRLVELNLLPESARASIQVHNHLRQQDLVVPWLDRTLISMHVD